jgi:hypothetical protein
MRPPRPRHEADRRAQDRHGCPATRGPRARPAGVALPRLQRRPADDRRRPGDRDRERLGAAARRGRGAPRRRAVAERRPHGRPRPALAGELLVLRPALRGDPCRAGVGVPGAPRPLRRGAQRPGHRLGPGDRRLRPAPDGPATDAAGLRRHPRRHVRIRLVGRGCERAERPGRPDERARRDALAARRLGALVRRRGLVVHRGPAHQGGSHGAAGRRRLRARHDTGRPGDGQPLPVGRRRRGSGDRGRRARGEGLGQGRSTGWEDGGR